METFLKRRNIRFGTVKVYMEGSAENFKKNYEMN